MFRPHDQNPTRFSLGQRPVFFPAAGLSLGSVLAWELREQPSGFWLLLIPALLPVFWCTRKYRQPALLWGLLCLLASTVICQTRMADQQRLAEGSGVVRLTATVLRAPKVRAGRLSFYVKDARGRRFIIEDRKARFSDAPECGDEIEGAFLAELPAGARNPGGFAENRYLAGEGVYVKLKVKPQAVVRVRKRSVPAGPFAAASRLRHLLDERLRDWLGEADGGLAIAMVYGDDGGLDAETKETYRAAGLAHLMAASGSNVGAVTALSLPLLLLRGGRRRKKILISLAVTLVYAFLTGWEATVTRAVLMYSLNLTAGFFKRRGDPLNHLFVTVAVMTALFPPFAHRTGFWMSVAVTAAVILLQPILKNFFAERLLLPADSRAARVNDSIALTLAATAGSLPFVFWFDRPVSPLFPLLNLLAVPLSAAVVGLGLLLSVICFMPLLPAILAYALQAALHLMNKLSAIGSQTTTAALFSGQAAALLSVLFPVCIFLLRRSKKKTFRRSFAVTGAVLLLMNFFIPGGGLLRRSDAIWFLDVGQGHAVLLQVGGQTILVDTGTRAAARQVVLPALRALQVRKLDLLILTHLDEDHAGGLEPLRQAHMVDCIAACPFETARLAEPERFAAGVPPGCKWVELTTGDRIAAGEDLQLDILWPREHRTGGNEDSIVILVTWGRLKLLLTGDAGTDQEQIWLRSGLLSDCDLLQVGHHGSRLSTGESFCGRSNRRSPSSRRYNPYGHPSEAVLDRLSASGCTVLTTADCGALYVRPEPGGYSVTSYLQPALKFSNCWPKGAQVR